MRILNRVYQILRAHSHGGADNTWEPAAQQESHTQDNDHSYSQTNGKHTTQDSQLAQYYANLELPYGADLATARRAWKLQLKKYHPDLHAQDPEKRQIATQLTAELTKAFQEIEKALSKKETG